MVARASGQILVPGRRPVGSRCMRLVTLGVGAQNSPRYAPAGLLVAYAGIRIVIDGGPGAIPRGRLDAWLVTDERSELMTAIRRMARLRGLLPYAGPLRRRALRI